VVLGVGGGGETHALFILAAIERQFVAVVVQGLAETGDVAVPEDGETAAAQAKLFPVNLDKLVGKMADDGLSQGQADGFGLCCHASLRRFGVIFGSRLTYGIALGQETGY